MQGELDRERAKTLRPTCLDPIEVLAAYGAEAEAAPREPPPGFRATTVEDRRGWARQRMLRAIFD